VSSPHHRSPDAVAYGIDMIALVKGASIAFTVLVIGGLATPLIASLVPVAGASTVWAVLVSAAGFVLAGGRIGEATQPALHGAAAALAAYLLVLPLIALWGTPLVWRQVAVTALVAAAVGAVAGAVSGRRRGPVL
jgi:hypothetical protein